MSHAPRPEDNPGTLAEDLGDNRCRHLREDGRYCGVFTEKYLLPKPNCSRHYPDYTIHYKLYCPIHEVRK